MTGNQAILQDRPDAKTTSGEITLECARTISSLENRQEKLLVPK